MRFSALWVGLALCGICRAALAQGALSTAPVGSGETAPLPPTVTVGPQREEAPPASSNMDDVFGGGDSNEERRWREAHPSQLSLNAVHLKPFRANRHWYGWQVFTSDAVSGALVGVGLALGSWPRTADARALALPGTVGYLFGAPLIHLAHDRPGMSGASFGLRLPVAFLGAGLALGLQNCKPADGGDFCVGPGLVPAFFSWLALTSVLDATLFAWDNPNPKPVTSASFGLTPALSPDGKSGELRAFGQF
jgi:hypothetical protein